MEVTYLLEKEDLLESQLYFSSKSKIIKKKRVLNRTLIPIFYVLFGIYYYFRLGAVKGIKVMILLAVIAILWYILFPFYDRRAIKKSILKWIDENYKNRIKKVVTISLDGDALKIESDGENGSIKISEIEAIEEIKMHIYIKIKTGSSIILPKDRIGIERIEEFIKVLEEKTGLKTIKKLEWKWQ